MHAFIDLNKKPAARIVTALFMLPFLTSMSLLVLYAPQAVAAQPGRGAGSDLFAPRFEDAEEPAQARPYYAPEVAEAYDEAWEERAARVAERLPQNMLPSSLQRQGKEQSAAKISIQDTQAAGTGGWKPLSRPYAPVPDPNVSYYGSPRSGIIDNSGRLHYIYERSTTTDVSQPPDAPGFRQENLSDIYYAMYSEGVWSTSINLTNVSGLGDSSVVYYDLDPEGYFHVIYTLWTWGRDPSRPAGESGAYQHQGENLWYRYLSPEGAWSAPRQLTSYAGSWALLGADFAQKNGRLYGAWTCLLNYETLPPSYRAQVGFMEGAGNSWQTPRELHAWDFNGDPGQLQPDLWPSIDISSLDDRVVLVNSARTIPGALYTGKVDIYGYARDNSGAWSGPENLTHAAGNSCWTPFIVIFRNVADKASVLAFQDVYTIDATHPPRGDIFIIDYSTGAWNAPTNVSRADPLQPCSFTEIEMDPFQNLHFAITYFTCAWTGASWEPRGVEFKYTRETPGGFSEPATILAYQFQRYLTEARMIIDKDGYAHTLFTAFNYDGVSRSDYSLNYANNRSAGGSFSAPEKIRPESSYEIYGINLSAFPDGDVLASWFEKGFGPGGEPVHGGMYSRYRDGSAWKAPVTVSSVPASSDILHIEALSYPSHEEIEATETGEQRCLFETAKYNPVTHSQYDFRKYFAETTGGVWGTPQLISDSGPSGYYPALYVDDNQRVFALYESSDPATNKTVFYATMQSEPTPPACTYYFAEGTTRHGFEEWICIQNPGDEDASVTITYMLESGENVVEEHAVSAHSRRTVNVNDAVGPEHDVSAKVEADRLIVAERPMYFLYGGMADGGHCVMGATETSRLWYFAEGTTRLGFVEYLTIQNPCESDAQVGVTYLLEDGTTRHGEIEVKGRSRATINVNDAVGPEHDLSMVVESPEVAVVAERPMYFLYQGELSGGHCVMGSTSLSDRWYFAEGTTRSGFDTYICLQNPHQVDTEAQLTFILGDGSTVSRVMNLPATSRQTLKINDAIGPGKDVSTVVRSASPILAERPMYFSYQGKWAGGHVESGSLSPKNAWYFAEGTTREGFEEWLTLQNPGDTDSRTVLSFMLEDGSVQEHTLEVPAHTRVTCYVPQLVGLGRDVSVAVWSEKAIVAERPMYFIYRGLWAGGHDVKGL